MKKIKAFNSLAVGFGFIAVSNAASAATENGAPVVSTLVSLFIVLAAIGVVAVVVKRLRLGGVPDTRLLRIVSQLSVGVKEKISIVEVDDQWLVLGVTAHQITLLTQIARKENIAQIPEPANFAKLFKLARGKHDKA